MKYKVILSKEVDLQINNIGAYIAKRFGEEKSFEALKEIRDTLLSLGTMPNIGRDSKIFQLRQQNIKVLVTQKNIVLYKIIEKEKVVKVYAVFDQRQDYTNRIIF